MATTKTPEANVNRSNVTSVVINSLSAAKTAAKELISDAMTLSQAVKSLQGLYKAHKALFNAIGINNSNEINFKKIKELWTLKDEEGNFAMYVPTSYRIDKKTAYTLTTDNKGNNKYEAYKVLRLKAIEYFSPYSIINGLIQCAYKGEVENEKNRLDVLTSTLHMFYCQTSKTDKGSTITKTYLPFEAHNKEADKLNEVIVNVNVSETPAPAPKKDKAKKEKAA